MDHVAHLIDVGLHGHGGVHHQDHSSAERIGIGGQDRRVVGRCPRGVARVDGGHVEQLHRLAILVKALARVENRQQVELVLRHGAGGRFQGQHLLVILVVLLGLEQHVLGVRRVGQQLFHFTRLTQEHHRRPTGTFGELEHQALFPVADLGSRQPAVAAPVCGSADPHPGAAIDVFALIHIQHRERRQLLAGRGTRFGGKFRPRFAEHSLEQGFLAGHQQWTLTAIGFRRRGRLDRWRFGVLHRRRFRCFHRWFTGRGRVCHRLLGGFAAITG
ncbi:hypothetical protein ALO79_200123 [Pseudomonas syringae pv. castaneae]|uniref:Uncharacterized protein n=1 Tax=Pseudomonas syringae pv. castaneae TaxID=264450 RepID=A0A0P9NML2_PSESX|nr:hypothetical protein ALO79_200123 [Pseudomonas syringae pv. castaneae]